MKIRKTFKILAVLAAVLMAVSAQAAVITSAVSSSGSASVGGTLVEGTLYMTPSRTHALVNIPATMVNVCDYVKVSQDDRDDNPYTLTLTLSSDAEVFVVIDDRLAATPMPWLAEMGFTNTGLVCDMDENYNPLTPSVDRPGMPVYSGLFPAGTVVLKEPLASGKNMYCAAAKPAAPTATNPDPANGQTLVALDKNLSWQAPSNPNLDPNYTILYRLYADPNQTKVSTGTGCQYSRNWDISTTYDPSTNFANGITYYWRVDSDAKLTGKDPNVYKGTIWSFTSIPASPIPDAGANILTSLDMLPAQIAGTVTVEGNLLSSVAWTYLADDSANPSVPVNGTGMRTINRGAYTADPNYTNLLQDWIAADAREKGCDHLKLTLSNLPAGVYSWKSYHHDNNDQTGIFDLTIVDADGAHAPIMGDISNGAAQPFDPNVTRITTSIRSDGVNPVTLTFDQRYTAGQAASLAFTVINGFDLVSDTMDPDLKVDFGQATTPVQTDYTAYGAGDKVLADFKAQTYSAFGATNITVNPNFGRVVNAGVTNTTGGNLFAPTATFTTDIIGTYKVKLSATNSSGTGTDMMEIRVYADKCAAAKANPAGYTKPVYDLNNDCKEDLADVNLVAQEWLKDISLTAQAAFTGAVSHDPISQP